MKKIAKGICTILAIIVFAGLNSCVKEPAEVELTVTASKQGDVFAGEDITFLIEAKAEFVTFYNGLPGAQVTDYPNVIARVIELRDGKAELTRKYFYHGELKPTFRAFSYGNWSEDVAMAEAVINLNVIDNLTGILEAGIKQNRVGGLTFAGIINNETGVITFKVPSDRSAFLSGLVQISFVAESSNAKVLYKNEVRNSPITSVNLTESATLVVQATNGDSREYTLVTEII